MRVLIVEDEALTAVTLAEALRTAGHDVIGPAYGSREALSLAKTERPELAFVDVDLERQGAGIAVAHELTDLFNVAVVFTTGSPERVRNSAEGIGLMAKPYDPDDAARTIPVIVAILAGDMPSPRSIPSALELFPTSKSLQKRRTRSAPCMRPILLIEDHPNDIELTLAALHRCSVANPIVVARDGREALDRLLPAPPPNEMPAVLLLDLKMPRVDGFEVLRRVKSDPQLCVIPVVVLSASSHEDDVRRSYESGAYAVVTKPGSFSELTQILQTFDGFWEKHDGTAAARLH
jgi:CheY-like chemotaxis protein